MLVGEVFLTALLRGEFSFPSLAPVFMGATSLPPGVDSAERPSSPVFDSDVKLSFLSFGNAIIWNR